MACLVFGPFWDFLNLFGPFRVRVGPFLTKPVSNHTNSSRRIDPRYPGALGNYFDFLFVFLNLVFDVFSESPRRDSARAKSPVLGI